MVDYALGGQRLRYLRPLSSSLFLDRAQVIYLSQFIIHKTVIVHSVTGITSHLIGHTVNIDFGWTINGNQFNNHGQVTNKYQQRSEHEQDDRLDSYHRLRRGWVLAVCRRERQGTREGILSIIPLWQRSLSRTYQEVEVVAWTLLAKNQPRGVGNIERRGRLSHATRGWNSTFATLMALQRLWGIKNAPAWKRYSRPRLKRTKTA